MHLLDVNVWLALAFDSHVQHVRAAAWFLAAQTDSCCFCRLTQSSFLRLASTPQVMMDRALTLHQAWRAYDDLYNDPRVAYAEEPEGIEQCLSSSECPNRNPVQATATETSAENRSVSADT